MQSFTAIRKNEVNYSHRMIISEQSIQHVEKAHLIKVQTYIFERQRWVRTRYEFCKCLSKRDYDGCGDSIT